MPVFSLLFALYNILAIFVRTELSFVVLLFIHINAFVVQWIEQKFPKL